MSTTNPVRDRLGGASTMPLREHWMLFFGEGLVLLGLGLAAVLLPQFATYAVESVVGWLFLMSGLIGLTTSIWMRRAAGFWWAMLSALIGIATGVILLRWPLGGILSLTLVVGAFFVVEGVASIMLALDHRRASSGRWGWMLASGFIDVGLAAMIISGLPDTAGWAIGLLVGINLAVGGSALVGMALHARPSNPRPAATGAASLNAVNSRS